MTANPYMTPWTDRAPGQLDPPAGVTAEDYARWLAHREAQDARLVCRSCGADNAVTDCRPGCPAAAGACDCRHPHCGECMRTMGTSTSGIRDGGHR